MAKNYAYLVCVDSRSNHNKFYEITENDNGSLDIAHGRVDKTAIHYEPWEKTFDGLKSEKERKGYRDVTALHMKKEVSSDKVAELSYKPVEDPVVQAALDKMIESSRMFISQNYSITADKITQKMIDEAQYDLSRLSSIAESNSPAALYEFNKALEELFMDRCLTS